MADIIKLARELGAALQADERYESLMQARKTNDEDVELEKLIGEFNLLMLQANQIAEKGDDADRLTKTLCKNTTRLWLTKI